MPEQLNACASVSRVTRKLISLFRLTTFSQFHSVSLRLNSWRGCRQTMEIHVVAVEARSPLGNYANTQASGLAMWPAAGAPLIVTTCNIKPGSTVTVAFSGVKLGDRQVVEAQLTASTRLRQASEAFLSLESRGWRCSDPGPSLGAGLHLHLLRLAADCQKPYHDGLSSCWSEPQEQWISRDVQLVFAPFGARSAQAANPLSLWTLVARGSRQHFACVVLVLLRSHRSYAILLGSSIVLTQCSLCHDDKLVMPTSLWLQFVRMNP